MKRIVTFCALCALFGCRQANTPETDPIALYYSTVEQSKTDLLTQGEQIGVFSNIEGTEHSFLENVPFVVGSDGRSLSTTPAVYYPEAKQAINFYAYLPFGGTWDGGVGTFSVPSDQTTAAALKQADLCWATASSTPVAAPVALEFSHKMARLLITTNEPTERIAIPNAFSGGILDIKTGTFTNTLQSEVFTTGTELIVPAQPLTRLLLTVAGVEHPFTPAVPLDLPAGQTTTLNLTLNPITKTATLAGSSVGEWGTASGAGNSTQAAANTLTIHWPKCHPQSGSVDEVVLRIKDHTTNTTAEYTVSSGITYADQTFTVPFASTVVFYPYTIETIRLYRSGAWLHESINIVGGTMVKRGACVVGVRQPLNPPAEGDYVEIDMGSGKKLKWAKGNLVAVNNSECKVGAPTDGGLYFQFGSLIGYKGGAQANGGTGVGSNPYTGGGTQWWGGVGGYMWANDAMVWPTELVGTKTSWNSTTGANITTLSDYYFNYSAVSWADMGRDLSSFSLSISGDSGSGTWQSGRYAKQGVGDPCTYYLGGTWRLPTVSEWGDLFQNKYANGTVGGLWPGAGQNWGSPQANNQRIGTIASSSYTNDANSPTVGRGIYANTAATTGAAAASDANALFFPASGYRNNSHGSFDGVGRNGYGWSSAVSSATSGFTLDFNPTYVYPQNNLSRSFGFPVRCVGSVP